MILKYTEFVLEFLQPTVDKPLLGKDAREVKSRVDLQLNNQERKEDYENGQAQVKPEIDKNVTKTLQKQMDLIQKRKMELEKQLQDAELRQQKQEIEQINKAMADTTNNINAMAQKIEYLQKSYQ